MSVTDDWSFVLGDAPPMAHPMERCVRLRLLDALEGRSVCGDACSFSALGVLGDLVASTR